MNLKTLIIAFFACLFFITSCIKSEGPDREADIESFTIDSDNLLTTVYDENRMKISLVLKDTTGYRKKTIEPIITVSKGATVEPASGTPVTLNNYQHFFTVKAQNGGEKTYLVVVEPLDQLGQDFEQWDVVNQGDPINEYLIPSSYMWVNANAGVRMVWKGGEYPTSRASKMDNPENVRPGSTGNYSAKLSTKDGNYNEVSDQMDIPVVSGNMYRGTFNALIALSDPLKTTNFGQPYPEFLGNPKQFKVWYKYKRGEGRYTSYDYVNGKKVRKFTDEIDMPDIYAILYKVPKGKDGINVFLTAMDIKTSDKIVATAIMDHASVKENEWVHLEIPFTYREQINHSTNDYKLAIVLASSTNGAHYKGTIGSVLLVDDLEVTTDDKKIN